MKKANLQILILAGVMALSVMTGSAATLDATDVMSEPDQLEFAKITRQPEDSMVGIGSNVTFRVSAQNGDSFQWVRNGVVLEGQTNTSLTIENAGTEDVGSYTCFVYKDGEAVPTRSANLNVYATMGGGGGGGGPICVYGTPVFSGGSKPGCPGSFIGYVCFSKTAAQGWGWAPTAGTTLHTATDTNRTNTKIEYTGMMVDMGCAPTTVAVPHPTYSPRYRFTVYFTNNVPTNTYSIVLNGFDP